MLCAAAACRRRCAGAASTCSASSTRAPAGRAPAHDRPLLLRPEPGGRAAALRRCASPRQRAALLRHAPLRPRLGAARRAQEDDFFAAMGPEPFGDRLHDRLPARRAAQGRRAPLKSFLLDQRHIAGVGNIYADEALFRARLNPLRAAGSVGPGEVAAPARRPARDAAARHRPRGRRRSRASSTRPAHAAPFRRSSTSTGAPASPATCAARRCERLEWADAAPTSARAASRAARPPARRWRARGTRAGAARTARTRPAASARDGARRTGSSGAAGDRSGRAPS